MSLSDRESEADRREASMRTGSNATRERARRGIPSLDQDCGHDDTRLSNRYVSHLYSTNENCAE